MSNVLIVAETAAGNMKKSAFEVATIAKKIATGSGSVTALVVGSGVADSAPALGEYGVATVLLADDASLENYHPDFYKAVVLKAVETVSPSVILFSASLGGKDLAPRVAAALKAPLASDCTSVGTENDRLLFTRPLYAGKVLATVQLEGKPVIASLRPNVFDAVKSDEGKAATVENIDVPSVETNVKVLEVNRSRGDKPDVAEADVIVTGGRGMRDVGNFKLIEELADTLQGAVGATRAVVDAGWRPHEEQVGQTGKVVSPNLYIMCGASGSIQHWAGMSGSRCIVAINKDAAAPIMSRADYSIVGDVFEVLPALNEEIKKVRG